MQALIRGITAIFVAFLLLIATPSLSSYSKDNSASSENFILDFKIKENFILDFKINISYGLGWRVDVPDPIVIVPGKEYKINLMVINDLESTKLASVMWGYLPSGIAKYITIKECFCYNINKLDGKRISELPIILSIDPAILKDRKFKKNKKILIRFNFYPYIKR